MKFSSAIFTELSGSIGGATASKARGGVKYLRARITPSNPLTTFQTAIRNIMAGTASAWRATLTQAQRVAWNDLALASNGTLQGMSLYVAANTVLIQGTGARVDDAPTSASSTLTPPSAAPSLSAGAGMIAFTLANVTDEWAATQGGVLNVYATKLQSNSRLSRQFPFQFVGSQLRGVAAPNTAQTFEYPTSLGIPVAGDVFYVRLVACSVDGRPTGQQIFRVVAGA